MKHTPGPLPSSCLTCRQKKKKCDKRRPTCVACLDSGLKCLGYDYIPQPFPPASSVKGVSRLRPLAPKIPPSDVPGGGLRIHNRPVKCDQSQSPPSNGDSQPMPLTIQPNHRLILPAPRTISQVPPPSHLPFASSSQLEVQIQPQPSSLAVSQPCSLPFGLTATPRLELEVPDSSDSRRPAPISQLFASGELAQSTRRSPGTSAGYFDVSMLCSLPPRICPDPVTSGKFIEFILSQYEPLLNLIFFRPTQGCLDLARKGMVMRLRSSSLIHWSMYVGARVFQALMKDGKRADLCYLRSCLRRLGQLICVKSFSESSIDELAHSLTSGLELIFLDFQISNGQEGYALLNNLVPIFLQLAFTDVDIYSRQLDPSSTGISFSHALVSPIHELRRFVFIDTIASITFGAPPLIEYDMSFPPINRLRPLRLEDEWVDGSAPGFTPEFIFLLAKVNIWRAKHPGEPAPESVWRVLEAQARAYEWGTGREQESEGLEVIGRVAILEGWRHAVLIYLYMGMCGFTSDNRRVQSSVQQIMRLLRVLKQDWSMRTHFFIPCLMACICTPDEKHRAELSDAFLEVEDSQPWLFKAMDYKPAIDHLWHGAASNGRPVRWEDYVDLGPATLPIR